MKFVSLIFYIFLLTSCSKDSPSNENFFPSNVFDEREDLDQFKAAWYSSHLSALGEEPLFPGKGTNNFEIYRFTLLRSFHNPISIRLEVLGEEANLTLRVTDGHGGYHPGKKIVEREKSVGVEKLKLVRDLFKKSEFWGLPTSVDYQGLDGSHWIIEGLKNGR